MNIYSVNEAAVRLGISKQTLLRYEKKGVFPRSRRNRINHWREYTEEDIQRMRQIMGRGFTLMEMVMVIVLIAIVVAVAIPRFQALDSVRLAAASRKLTADIRYVQQLAISQHVPLRIAFDKDANSYDVRFASNNSLIIHPFSRQNFSVDFDSDPQFRGIDIEEALFGGTAGLQFNWQGIPQNSAGVNLPAEGMINLSYGPETATLFVRPNTGAVRIE